MIDIHSHILPKIDDGSKNSDMSVEMLKLSSRQGVTHIVATPHFYLKHDNVDDFLNYRKASFDALKKKIKLLRETDEFQIPEIFLGAEVYFFRNICEFEQLNALCIENTNYLLLEMPFDRWDDRVISDVDNIYYNRKITPVIAHLERFVPFQKGTDNIEKLINLGYPIQVNGEFFNNFFTRSKAVKMLQSGVIRLLGSDCHNLDSRKPNLGQTTDIIRKKCGDAAVENIIDFSKKILNI